MCTKVVASLRSDKPSPAFQCSSIWYAAVSLESGAKSGICLWKTPASKFHEFARQNAMQKGSTALAS
jgi:hypothetical protein